MSQFNVSAADLPALFKQLETARISRTADAVFEAAEAGVPVIADAAPVDMGELRRSVHAEHFGHLGSRILVDAPHAGIAELGSRPHWAPLQPLIDWVRRHQILFRTGWRNARRARKHRETLRRYIHRARLYNSRQALARRKVEQAYEKRWKQAEAREVRSHVEGRKRARREAAKARAAERRVLAKARQATARQRAKERAYNKRWRAAEKRHFARSRRRKKR